MGKWVFSNTTGLTMIWYNLLGEQFGCAYQNEKCALISHFLEPISTSRCVYYVHSNVRYIMAYERKTKNPTHPPNNLEATYIVHQHRNG